MTSSAVLLSSLEATDSDMVCCACADGTIQSFNSCSSEGICWLRKFGCPFVPHCMSTVSLPTARAADGRPEASFLTPSFFVGGRAQCGLVLEPDSTNDHRWKIAFPVLGMPAALLDAASVPPELSTLQLPAVMSLLNDGYLYWLLCVQ